MGHIIRGKTEAELVVEEIISTVSMAENVVEEEQVALSTTMPPRRNDNNNSNDDNNLKTAAAHAMQGHHHLQHKLEIKDNDDNDCSETMLDQMDKCVGCVEGVEVQQAFEEELTEHDLVELSFVPTPHQSLSATEAALIRLQIMDKQQQQQEEEEAQRHDKGFKSLQDIDLLNICGSDEELSVSRACASSSSADLVPGRTATPSPPSTKNDTEEANTTMDTTATDGTLDGSFMAAATAADDATATVDNSNNNEDTTDLLPPQNHFCAVCLDEAATTTDRAQHNHHFAQELPCCRTIKICTACILVLTAPTTGSINDGAASTSRRSRVGRCPGCQSWIEVQAPKSITEQKEKLEITTIAVSGKCQVCCQVKDQLVEDAKVCDACFLGKRNPMLYECESCHVRQRIEHPMYRYQPSPDKFGNVSWACRRCETFTHWKILPDQVRMIPVGDTPKSWGDDYLVLARIRVQQTRKELAKSHQANNNGCVIL